MKGNGIHRVGSDRMDIERESEIHYFICKMTHMNKWWGSDSSRVFFGVHRVGF